MGWPFTSSAPTFDSTVMDVPIVSAAIPAQTASPVYVVCFRFTNNVAVAVTVTVKDGAGKEIVSGAEVSPLAPPVVIEVPFEPLTGPLTWFASALGVVGHVWGYQ